MPLYPISGGYIEGGSVEHAGYSDKATRAVDNPLVPWIRVMPGTIQHIEYRENVKGYIPCDGPFNVLS